MKHTHATKTLLAGLALISTLGLTACNGDDTGNTGAGSPDTASSATAGGSGGSGGGSDQGSGGGTSGSTGGNDSAGGGQGKSGGNDSGQGTGAGTGSDTGGKTGICRSDELEVSAVDNSTDKTEGVVTVQLENGGGRDCTINGYAGVDLKTATGDTLSVDRNGEKPHAGVLKDGESAAFNITFPINNSGGSGVRVSKILVTPPNETKTVTIAWPAGSLPVANPDAPSGGPKLSISPVGTVSDSPAG
ncbi:MULTISPECIES: DUF4232 domain-containing protein [unclassified Streptomyces]|uniref:DUF4232 domain-containing protein n=1 Tax=unclassified Streptomyces TaxID=2593676 RepID=UPI0013715A64|nr:MULTISPECIES: DUF4232 domain-containing protein [unclassified Streptomyces]NDZ99435.1 DUF4232 domain-containing protein [Streptomyces sp. SID10116]MYY84969.1 DUF4232 domain-containing protein [Streptomyces sp. SID335]MYZ19670.1 DUF4232 domain-containing protein [Streptomyces sp. SID337]NDZ92113.1 DUF4232 domain-containing protein [Streptomyces sp. SID10115]NEB46768.1 DUF4232 domain-containing protein [Streptomyces sp. SID339]